ncbi:MAG TPA: metallophosphoesterase [Clostridia bacterium]|nr:metallophosphoesterase [Clostridia bacterium]
MARIKSSGFYKILAFIFTVIGVLGIYAAPSTEDPITALDEPAVQLSFAAWADTHLGTYNFSREPAFKNAVTDIANATTTPDALIIAGDLTENGLAEEYVLFYDNLRRCENVENYVIASGNHDIRFRYHQHTVERFTSLFNEFTGNSIDSLYYSSVVNGYYFIVLGSEEQAMEKAIISNEQLLWLDEMLAEGTASGLPVFVIVHQPLKKTHGLPNMWSDVGFWESGDIGEQSDDVLAILRKYEDVFLISGHVHTGIGSYTYEKVDNIHSINLPPLTKKCSGGDFNEKGGGFMVEVYENKVVFRARDFFEGRYLPEFDFEVEF